MGTPPPLVEKIHSVVFDGLPYLILNLRAGGSKIGKGVPAMPSIPLDDFYSYWNVHIG